MDHIPFELSQITDYIFIGTNACCSTHFDERLLAIGIKADISLETNLIDQPFGVEFYLWLPVGDHQAPELDQLKIGVDVLNNLINEKESLCSLRKRTWSSANLGRRLFNDSRDED